MAKYEHLTKERELELGGVIQRRAQALERLTNPRLQDKTRDRLKRQVAEGEAAIDELVKANLGLVYDRARAFKYKFPGAPDMEDLVSMGTIGLMTAVHKYDPARGNKFSTLAYYWISQAIGREVNKTSRMVRLPENRISDYSRMNAIATRYEEHGAGSTELDQLIMHELGLTRTEILNIRNAAATHSSLNRKVGSADDGGSKELMDIVGEANPTLETEHTVVTAECFRALQEELQNLEPLKQQVVAAQYALSFGDTYPTAAEVREEHGLSSSKFRRILAESLDELKRALALRELTLPDFLELDS